MHTLHVDADIAQGAAKCWQVLCTPMQTLHTDAGAAQGAALGQPSAGRCCVHIRRHCIQI